MSHLKIYIFCWWCFHCAVANENAGGLAASAVGNGYAFSSDGRRMVEADGRRGPDAATVGNGMATSFDGRRYVASYQGKPVDQQDIPPFTYADNRGKPLHAHRVKPKSAPNADRAKSQTKAKGFAGAGFNPFHAVGLQDPRLMLQRQRH